MAALDFPSSPTLGQIFTSPNGPVYIWNGSAWMGGSAAGPMTEQVFDMSGKTAQDITVPSWARHCAIEGFGFAMPSQFVMRYSLDGSTFLAGASDYGSAGPYHNTGTALYQTQAFVNQAFMYLTYGGDVVTVPHHFLANITLTRPDTAKSLGYMLAMGHESDSAAANLYRTQWSSGLLTVAASGSALRIAALRILLMGGQAMPTGSWCRVKWHGDSAQVPISNAIPEAPADGLDYVRNNGVWQRAPVSRISSGVVASAVANVDVALPAGFLSYELLVTNYLPANDAQPLLLRLSLDGSTFPSAGNYNYSLNLTGQTGGNTPTGGTGTNHIWVTGNMSSNVLGKANARITLPVPASDGCQHAIIDSSYRESSAGQITRGAGTGVLGSNAGIAQALRLLHGTGNIAAMRWQLNGYR